MRIEFDRVGKGLESAARQNSLDPETRAVIAMIEEKRAEVIAKEDAGYSRR